MSEFASFPANARAITAGHGIAFGVFQIAPEKRPGPADVGLCWMYAAALAGPEKYAKAIRPDCQNKLSPRHFAIFFRHAFDRKAKPGGKPRGVLRAHHYSAPAFTALTAFPAFKHITPHCKILQNFHLFHKPRECKILFS